MPYPRCINIGSIVIESFGGKSARITFITDLLLATVVFGGFIHKIGRRGSFNSTSVFTKKEAIALLERKSSSRLMGESYGEIPDIGNKAPSALFSNTGYFTGISDHLR